MHYEHYLKYKEISMKRPKSLSLSHEDVRIAMAKNSALYEENFKEMKLYVGTPQIKKYLLKEKILNRNDIRLRKLLKHF